MIRITAEASNTRLAISARTVLADQFLRRMIKATPAVLVREGMQIGESLLAQAPMVPARSVLQELMQGIGQIADLERRHAGEPPGACILLAICSSAPSAATALPKARHQSRSAPSSRGTMPLMSSNTPAGASSWRHCSAASPQNWRWATAATTALYRLLAGNLGSTAKP
jgi:hypothetical protein